MIWLGLKLHNENKNSSCPMPSMIGCCKSIWETFPMDGVYRWKGKKRKVVNIWNFSIIFFPFTETGKKSQNTLGPHSLMIQAYAS